MSSPPVEITSEPRQALVDERLRIQVRNLAVNQRVTVHHLINNDGKRFGAFAHYVSGVDCVVDLSRDGAVGGSYRGVMPMGLFTHMEQLPGQRKGLRLVQKRVEEPVISELSVFDSHLSGDDMYTDGGGLITDTAGKLATTTINRYYMSEDVITRPVRVGNIRGALFMPKGPGPFPGVIDMFGTVGGLTQFRSALLASRGFAAFSLAYFNYEDLPGTFDVDLAYFEEACEWLYHHDQVLSGGIGVIGVSRGAEMAADMFTHFSQYVKAAICINGNYFYWRCSYKGKPMGKFKGEPVRQDHVTKVLADWRMVDDGLTFMPDEANKKMLSAEYDSELDGVAIPVERGTGNIMYIVGTNDKCCPAVEMAHMSCRRLQHAGRANYHMLQYDGAGHLIEPPYAPLCAIAYHPPFNALMWFGGEKDGHAKAQEDSWQRILTFFRQNLLTSSSKMAAGVAGQVASSRL